MKYGYNSMVELTGNRQRFDSSYPFDRSGSRKGPYQIIKMLPEK
jgi:hypothetical protein